MYAEAEFKFDWSNALKKLIVLATTALLIFLIFYLFNNNKEQNTYFEDNLITMTNVAKNYFNNHEYTNNKITLEEMINKNFIYKRGVYCCSKPKILYEQGKAKVKRRQIRNDNRK